MIILIFRGIGGLKAINRNVIALLFEGDYQNDMNYHYIVNR